MTWKTLTTLALLAPLALLVACGDDGTTPADDAGGMDVTGTDAGGDSSTGTDAGETDAGGTDTVGTDTVGTDAVGTDATVDAGEDTGGTDATRPTTCNSNAECDDHQYCNSDMCGRIGLCELRPETCTDIFDPVCGCDAMTYGNACSAAAAGVRVASDGECASRD